MPKKAKELSGIATNPALPRNGDATAVESVCRALLAQTEIIRQLSSQVEDLKKEIGILRNDIAYDLMPTIEQMFEDLWSEEGLDVAKKKN